MSNNPAPSENKKSSRHKYKWTRYYRRKYPKFRGVQFQKLCDKGSHSTSSKRIKLDDDGDIEFDETRGYRFVDFINVFSALSQFLICKDCQKDVKFEERTMKGLGFQLVVICECTSRFVNSCPIVNNTYEINRRFVFVMRLLGVGKHGINLFCGFMDLCQRFSTTIYCSSLYHIENASKYVYEEVLKKAVEEEKKLTAEKYGTENATRLTVSGDDTCKKRGFSFRFSMTTLIGNLSNKVIDLVLKSSFCQSCNDHKSKKGTQEYNIWYDSHEEECANNCKGNRRMKIDALKEMFGRSVEQHGIKYVSYIGDDEGYKAIVEFNPYGDDELVIKKECVVYLQKVMAVKLRKIKKNKNLSGEGVGKLTDDVIKELIMYYNLAVRRNTDSLENMKRAIWARFYHRSSTNERPHHEFCPKGLDSWCKWRHAEANGTTAEFYHEPPLDKNVLRAIKPVYESLSASSLLERCLGDFNQHSNKSFNSTFWKIAPKDLYSEPQIITIASYLATIVFNEGCFPLVTVLKLMGVKVGLYAKVCCEYSNGERIEAAGSSSATCEENLSDRQLQSAEKDEDLEESLHGSETSD
ncbi:uncharacterized protein LOC116840472 isoform X1 [Odontomachus brunneus]|uniref:uncharacterized protein LOC116840472 isoform X1 n=1 Tax=Odontomachus brunneus TaxID=486640 RepID=UPI0013F1EA33|nr:uncharacterized protein LOC116840472 isoform X1 [Odontomachus brunneus]XP_032663118.1 uncharacterized protein LOC116840472 isoform X1 [Odontomachus brunneus]XP_032663119.1 uncharacterized protein LOC116840472 isoform X1 [Odontomachus brunneus]XP_032663120.1 uncharacterized protein LOC116840472 isoform X1 [Odontomachus brunneus]XP_032663121.1 uncharacterized protein LOC116840472 isoform X1 [Odontomachus brunneus]XP_032663122.1 uncharacterized protein LOC116840472 isoform X1 [Odontomachus bru